MFLLSNYKGLSQGLCVSMLSEMGFNTPISAFCKIVKNYLVPFNPSLHSGTGGGRFDDMIKMVQMVSVWTETSGPY